MYSTFKGEGNIFTRYMGEDSIDNDEGEKNMFTSHKLFN